MRKLHLIAIALSGVAGVALAKLPAPSPEQQEAAAAKKAAEQAQLEKAKQALERAHDRTADHYKRTKGGASSNVTHGRVEDTNMPKTTRELPRGTAPQGGRQQSAEAHSAPAK